MLLCASRTTMLSEMRQFYFPGNHDMTDVQSEGPDGEDRKDAGAM